MSMYICRRKKCDFASKCKHFKPHRCNGCEKEKCAQSNIAGYDIFCVKILEKIKGIDEIVEEENG